MTSSNGTRPDPAIHGMVRDVPTSAGRDRGEVGGCVPRRFCDAVARAMALANLSLSTLTGRKPGLRGDGTGRAT